MNESTEEAAARELYEEIGMKVGLTDGLGVVGALPPDDAFAYAAGGGGMSHVFARLCFFALSLIMVSITNVSRSRHVRDAILRLAREEGSGWTEVGVLSLPSSHL